MPEIILHIGASKCGSSALQTTLTATPVMESLVGERLSYAVIREGELCIGSEVRPGPLGYASSVNPDLLSGMSDATLAKMGKRLLETDADKVVLSCEGWFTASKLFGERLLPAMGIAPRVVAYVRPQVDYLNAGWWQWGAWQEAHSFDDWLFRRTRLAHWVRTLTTWEDVAPITVRLLPNDVVSDFFRVAGFEPPAAERPRVNRGLPEVVLRLYQRNRVLRPSQHASQMDFILSQSLDLPGSTPWVISQENAAWVIDKVHRDNLRLLAMLDPESRAVMKADQRWWNAEAYKTKVVKDHGAVPPDIGQLEELHVALAKANARLGRKWSLSASRKKMSEENHPVPSDVTKLEASCVELARNIRRLNLDPGVEPVALAARHRPASGKMKKLVIQAGFPKCGSTSVFAALKHCARVLAQHDIFVLNNQFRLDRSGSVPVPAPQALEAELRAPESAAKLRTALEQAIRDCPDGGTLVICTEILSDPRKAHLFAGLERLCDMELVFYFRPQTQWLASAWKQWDLKSGVSIPKMIRLAVASKRPDYLGSARGWQSAIPQLKITPRPFLREAMTNGHPSYDFLKLLGVEVQTDPALEQRTNSSMDYALLHLFQRNSARIFKNRHDNAPYRNLMKNLPEAYCSTNIPMLNQRQSDLIANHFHDDNVELVHTYMGMDPDEAERFVRQHFHETVKEKAFTDHSEQEILERAGMILKEMTGKAGNPDEQLLEYLEHA